MTASRSPRSSVKWRYTVRSLTSASWATARMVRDCQSLTDDLRRSFLAAPTIRSRVSTDWARRAGLL